MFFYITHGNITISIYKCTLLYKLKGGEVFPVCSSKNFRIGEQIKYYRTKKKMSQESLALSAGINPAFVGQIERGVKSPTVHTLQKIAGALEISLAELFTPWEKPGEMSQMREIDMERISYLLGGLSDEDVALVSQILAGIIKIKKS